MNLWLEVINCRQKLGETWSHGTNAPLPFVVNVALNFSNPLLENRVCYLTMAVNKEVEHDRPSE